MKVLFVCVCVCVCSSQSIRFYRKLNWTQKSTHKKLHWFWLLEEGENKQSENKNNKHSRQTQNRNSHTAVKHNFTREWTNPENVLERSTCECSTDYYSKLRRGTATADFFCKCLNRCVWFCVTGLCVCVIFCDYVVMCVWFFCVNACVNDEMCDVCDCVW